MRVLVCGGRDFGDLLSLNGSKSDPRWPQREREYNFVLNQLGRLSLGWPKTPEDKYGNWLPDVVIISGKARGVDSIAIDWAVVNWCQFEEYPADWRKYGKAAGPIRNKQMLVLGKPSLVVAFPGGSGTANMIELARAANVKVIEIPYKENKE